jgi:hypothetical protein
MASPPVPSATKSEIAMRVRGVIPREIAMLVARDQLTPPGNGAVAPSMAFLGERIPPRVEEGRTPSYFRPRVRICCRGLCRFIAESSQLLCAVRLLTEQPADTHPCGSPPQSSSISSWRSRLAPANCFPSSPCEPQASRWASYSWPSSLSGPGFGESFWRGRLSLDRRRAFPWRPSGPTTSKDSASTSPLL